MWDASGMRWLAWIFGLVVALPIILLLGWVGAALLRAEFTKGDHRFRMTVEIETPEGLRSGSSVIRITRRDYDWMPLSGLSRTSQNHKVEGEAVFVALPGERHVIALLAHGLTGQDTDRIISLWTEAYLGWEGRWNEAAWTGARPLDGVAQLQTQMIPTLITFTDIADPASAKVIYAGGLRQLERFPGTEKYRTEPAVLIDEIAATFGPGFAFRRATIEMVPNGTPVTRGIEKRLPVIMGKLRELDKTMQLVHPKDPFRAHSGHLSIR
jgi:hypothetical protein